MKQALLNAPTEDQYVAGSSNEIGWIQGPHDGRLLVDTALAVAAVFTAIDEAKKPGPSTGSEPTPY